MPGQVRLLIDHGEPQVKTASLATTSNFATVLVAEDMVVVIKKSKIFTADCLLAIGSFPHTLVDSYSASRLVCSGSEPSRSSTLSLAFSTWGLQNGFRHNNPNYW